MRRIVCRLLCCCLLAFTTLSLWAAQRPTPPMPGATSTDPQAVQAAVNILSALGSSSGLVTVDATGIIESPGQDDGDFEILAASPRTYRTVTTRGSESYTYLMNDGIGEVTINGKTRHIGGSEIMGARCPFIPFYSFVGEFARPDVILAPTKAGTINGNPSVILTITDSDLSNPQYPIRSTSEMEVDAKTWLPHRLRTQLIHSDNLEIVSHLEYVYDDYRLEGPYLLPHKITLTVDGALAFTVTLNAFQFNVPANLTVAIP